MSTTFKINAVAVAADPRRVFWKPIDPLSGSHLGTRTQSRYREALLMFPTLISAEFNEWASRCNNNTAYVIYMPERVDAAYASSPETWTSTFYNFDTTYQFHYVGSRHSSGVYVYDTQILVYMVRVLNVVGGGG